MYTVKELFPTLQGEGTHAGRAAVFCRFAGCNLWSGREEDRATANELTLVIPQEGHDPLEKLLARFEKMDYRNRFLQPMDGPNLKMNTELAVNLCQKRPLWRLSLQSHKLIGIR